MGAWRTGKGNSRSGMTNKGRKQIPLGNDNEGTAPGRGSAEDAVAEGEDAVAAVGELEGVGDQDAGEFVLGVEAADEGEDDFGGFAVEVAGGLVGEQDAGLGD